MKIFTVMFDVDKAKTWTRLLNVFRESVRLHMPEVELVEKIIKAPRQVAGKSACMTYNTVKLGIWNDYIQEATEDTILIDCDMLCLRSAQHIFREKFDLALTFTGSGKGPPLNAGVVFVKPTARARQIMNTWVNVNSNMYDNNSLHQRYARKYLGMNQSALGCMIENRMIEDVKILKTREWNAVGTDWGKITDKTVFVHIKSELRNAIMMNAEPVGHLKKIMQQWYDIENSIMKREQPTPKVKKAIYVAGAYTRKLGR